MESVTVITPSRLHFALIDLNGCLGRIDGGIGLSLSKPGFLIRARSADRSPKGRAGMPAIQACSTTSFTRGDQKDFPLYKGGQGDLKITGQEENRQRARNVVKLLQERCHIGDIELEIEESIPAHVGLGSGTQLSLGIAQAVCKLYGINLGHQEMALLVERGGTSGIGVAAFFYGGFIVDGGHKFLSEKSSFLPSSASKGVRPPPVIARYDFPDWDILVAIPNCKHISGAEEVNLFQTLCPLPLNDVQALSHIILMKLLPSLVQHDLESFGEAVDQIQNMGWKKVEIEKQDPIVRLTMDFLRDNSACGVGLSSWGPAIFCFGKDLRSLEAKTQAFLADRNPGGYCFLTKANNTGAEVIVDPRFQGQSS